MGKARVAQELPRLAIVVLGDQDPARQYAERAFDDAHVLIEYEMVDIRTVKQRTDG